MWEYSHNVESPMDGESPHLWGARAPGSGARAAQNILILIHNITVMLLIMNMMIRSVQMLEK
jgi:hypothetical protein